MEAVRRASGAAPTGFRAPYWALGSETLELVEDAGYAYLVAPGQRLRAIPRSSGDSGRRDGLSAPSRVLEIWTGELRYALAHAPGGLLTVTMHPECIGRGHRMAMLEPFIAAAKSLEGVVFDRVDGYLENWQAAHP